MIARIVFTNPVEFGPLGVARSVASTEYTIEESGDWFRIRREGRPESFRVHASNVRCITENADSTEAIPAVAPMAAKRRR